MDLDYIGLVEGHIIDMKAREKEQHRITEDAIIKANTIRDERYELENLVERLKTAQTHAKQSIHTTPSNT